MIPFSTKSSLQELFINVQAPIGSSLENLKYLKNDLSIFCLSKKELVEEYKSLLRTNLYLQIQINDISSRFKMHNKSVNALEEIDSNFTTIYAHVIRRDLATWANIVIIDKGYNAGLSIGDGVISGHNVVGRIKTIYDNISIVELISSPNFKISACIEYDNFPLIYRGKGGNSLVKYSGIAENITTDLSKLHNKTEKVKIVSSCLSGIFPSGLTIGYISNVTEIKKGVFANAIVELDASFINNLHEVSVLINGIRNISL